MTTENEYLAEEQQNILSVIVFEVDKRQFAIKLTDAKEIIIKGQIRRMPQTLNFIEGVYNYRGEIIYIINLSKKLKLYKYRHYVSLKEDEKEVIKEKIIVITINNLNIGILVDRVLDISHLKKNAIVDLNIIFHTNRNLEYIQSVLKFENRPRILLDINKILSETEQKTIKKGLI